MNDELTADARLARLLARPERPPDEMFVGRVERARVAEGRMARDRRGAWLRFLTEASAAAAMAAAMLALPRLEPAAEASAALTMFNPTVAAAMLLGLWFALAGRPTAAKG